MKELPKISYVLHEQLNYQKWDSCINKSANGVIYAYSWYLDSVCDRWDAIIDDNYQIIMPIPLIRKRGKWHIRKSSWLIQLGVFSTKPVPEDILIRFLQLLTKKHKRWQMPLNVHNPRELNGHKLHEKHLRRKDLIYPLSTQQKLLKAEKESNKNEEMTITRGLQLAVIINFVLRVYGKKINSNELLALRRLVSFSSRMGFGFSYSVYSSLNNLIGLTYVFRLKKRIYMLFCIADEKANRKKIFQLLLNRIYRDFEKQDFVLECCPHSDRELIEVLDRNVFSHTPYGVIKRPKKILRHTNQPYTRLLLRY